MSQLFTNNAIARITSNISPIAMSIFVDPARAGLYPNPQFIDDYFLITLDNINNPDIYEIVKISHRTGNQLHVAERGFENTSAQTWLIDDTLCDHRVTAGTLDTFLPVTKLQHIVVPSNTSQVIDQFSISSENVSFKWAITLLDDASNKAQSFEIHAIKKMSGAVSYNKFAIVGDSMNVGCSVNLLGSTVSLAIQNNENSDVTINAIRILNL
jgi:hypothetical protein